MYADTNIQHVCTKNYCLCLDRAWRRRRFIAGDDGVYTAEEDDQNFTTIGEDNVDVSVTLGDNQDFAVTAGDNNDVLSTTGDVRNLAY